MAAGSASSLASYTGSNSGPGASRFGGTNTVLPSGTQALMTLVINDATPAFTTFVSAACPSPLPLGISACSVSSKPAVGAAGSLQWTFTGSLAPSAQLAVTYQVKVSQ
jgi:hypothetical protein